ncbi:MAG: hypothetical protein QXN35_03325 [Ignisphaera sp.]|uniref:Uncharacterized protein n=1 Tax=Ignisphaera aggregans TaxID=334771 RepID=A0A7C4D0B0_9CREN
MFQPWYTGGGIDYLVTKAFKVNGILKDFMHHVVTINYDPRTAGSYTNIQYRIGRPDVHGIATGLVELYLVISCYIS